MFADQLPPAMNARFHRRRNHAQAFGYFPDGQLLEVPQHNDFSVEIGQRLNCHNEINPQVRVGSRLQVLQFLNFIERNCLMKHLAGEPLAFAAGDQENLSGKSAE